MFINSMFIYVFLQRILFYEQALYLEANLLKQLCKLLFLSFYCQTSKDLLF